MKIFKNCKFNLLTIIVIFGIGSQLSLQGSENNYGTRSIFESTEDNDTVITRVFGNGTAGSLFVESSGKVHLFYASTNAVHYYFKEPAGEWKDTTLNYPGNHKGWVISSDIIADSEGYIHICYGLNPDNNNVYPMLVYLTNKGGTWTNKIIRINHIGFWSITMDINDRDVIHLLYQAAWGFAVPGSFLYMNLKSGQWSRPKIFDKDGYDHIDMMLDKNGFTHVINLGMGPGPVYRKSQDTIINNWTRPIPCSTPWSGGQLEGMTVDIAIDSLNDPHVIYPGNKYGESREDINYAKLIDGNWVSERIARGGFMSGSNAIAIDPLGTVHVAYYYDPDHSLIYKRMHENEWVGRKIAGLNSLDNVDLGVDKFGNAHLLYNDSWNNSIKYTLIRSENYFIVSPDTLNFGVVDSGASKTLYLTMYNPQSNPVTIDSIKLDNENFLIQPDNLVLQPGTKDSVAVEFSPVSNVKADAPLIIYYNESSQLFIEVPVLAATPIPELTVIPDPVNFGRVDIHSTETKNVILRNTGTDSLEISDLYVKFEFMGSEIHTDFKLESHDCDVIAPGDSCNVQISFTPQKKGSQMSYLHIFSNSYEAGYKTVTLVGNTTIAQVIPESFHLDFGYGEVNDTVTRNLRLYNYGQIDLNITANYIKGDDADAFSVSTPCTTIPAGDSCDMKIDFMPVDNKSCSAYLEVYSNSEYNNPLKVTLAGTTIWRELTFTPLFIDFGSYTISDNNPMQIVTLINDGDNDVDISEIIITGDDRFEFDHSGFSGTIAPGENVIDTIWFSPVFEGRKYASLHITSNDSDEPEMDIPLQGDAREPSPLSLNGITASPTSGTAPLQVEFHPDISGGYPPVNYSWTFGDQAVSTEEEPIHTYNDTGTFNVILTVTDNSGNTVADSITIIVSEPQKILSGQIYNEDGTEKITSGTVELYQEGNATCKSRLDIDGTNIYSFTDPGEGKFTVKFLPDSEQYPAGLPTYLGNVLTLAEANYVTADYNETGQDILVIGKPDDGTGNGKITGTLQKDEGVKSTIAVKENTVRYGDVLPGINVYLTNANTDELTGYDVTDADGYFEFTGLQNGSYIFKADFRNIPMDSQNPTLTISQETDSISILSTIHSENISLNLLTTGLNESRNIKEWMIYPNPARDFIIIRTGEKRSSATPILKIFNMYGKLVFESQVTLSNTDQEYICPVYDFPDGVYIISISNNEYTFKTRFIKLK